MKAKVIQLTLLICQAAWSQGLVAFSNLGQQVNAPVYQSDGLTALSGTQFMAELFGGLGSNALQAIASAPFMQGSAAIFPEEQRLFREQPLAEGNPMKTTVHSAPLCPPGIDGPEPDGTLGDYMNFCADCSLRLAFPGWTSWVFMAFLD
ncbi:MAG TPA: hypothetical protein VKY92_18160 [Verrucomicrobiae bacterium]|nr:hypothetical protein [Verrucomicrobiae bacterium]